MPSSPTLRVRTQPQTFAITAVTYERHRIFQRIATADVMLDTLFRNRAQGRFQLHAFVIMPDHLHVLLTPAPDKTIERCVQYIKGGFSFAIRNELKTAIWQDGYHAHRILDLHDFNNQRTYIAANPTRKMFAGHTHVHTHHPEHLDPTPTCLA